MKAKNMTRLDAIPYLEAMEKKAKGKKKRKALKIALTALNSLTKGYAAKAAVVLLFAGLSLIPTTAWGQMQGVSDTNGHGVATSSLNAHPASTAGNSNAKADSSTGTSASGGGEYVPSTFTSYEDALKTGKQQQAENAKPKTFAEQVKEAQAKTAAEKAAKAKAAVPELKPKS